jgi:hypothetical protein
MYKKLIILGFLLGVVAGLSPITEAALITNVVRRNPDGNSGDTEPRIAPNPLNEDQLCFVDRTHQYNSIPTYLIGAEYVMTANDDKDNVNHELDVTLSEAVTVYLFLDNRIQGSAQGTGGQGVNPNLSGMPWVAAMGFTDTGDDIGIDESGDGDIDQWSSVFSKKFPAGTITLKGQLQGYGGNMYGVAAMGPRLKARDPDPPDGAQDIITPLLQWTAGDTAALHDVYFGTNPSPGPAEFIVRQQHTAYFAAGVIPGNTYYWRIDEVEADGTTIHTGDVWSFTAASLTAYRPNPPDDAIYVSTDVLLSWRPGAGAILHDVYFGTDEAQVNNGTGDTFKTTVAATTFQPEPLTKNTTYYWRIDEFDGITKHKGQVWSFETVPDIPISDPNLLCWWKFDEGAGITALDWSGHDHHGTLERDPQWVDGLVGGALEFDGAGDRVVDNAAAAYLNGLNAVTVCMWIKSDLIGTDKGFINGEEPDGGDNVLTMRYDAAGGRGGGTNVLKMAVRAPNDEQQIETSSNLQTTEWQHVTMTWSVGQQLQFYLNGLLQTPLVNDPAITETTSGVTKLIVGQGSKDAGGGWDGLIDDVRIYNKVLTADEIKQAMRGDPTLAWNPKPANRALTDVELAVPLSWSPGDKAAQHDVYLGTDRTAVVNATTASTGVYRGRQAITSYTPAEGLQWGGGPYYWRIDEYNNDATISTGRVWSFTVADYLIVDDFEGYTDDVGNRIFQTWRDGWGYSEPPPGYPGNGTGSGVGNAQPPFAEQTTVHSGKQSMPLAYDNTGTGGKARYSEIQREWTTPQDWTRYDVKALTLWFYGDPANAAEQLYVALEDNAGMVKVGNHTDPEAVQASGWQEWNIPLTDFAGVNLKAIKKMYIGLGNRTSPKAGGTGAMYIDDIRLYRSRCVPSKAKPAASFNDDCVVDYLDMRIMADDWLVRDVAEPAWGTFTSQDIGAGTAAGSFSFDGNVYTIQADGADIWGTADAFRYAFRQVSGDFQMTVRVTSLDPVNTWSKAGVMVRQSLDPGSANAMIATSGTSGGGATFQWRPTQGASSSSQRLLESAYTVTEPACIRLVRQGNTISGYVFVGGRWRLEGQTTAVVLTGPVYVGLAVTSHVDGTLTTATFDRACTFSAAELHVDGVVDFRDFAVLADSWLDELLWP